MIRTLIRKVRSFAGLPLFTKVWLVPAWIELGLSRALILVVPFRTLAPRLGTAQGTAANVPLLTPAQEAQARAIGRTIRLAARYTPWTSNCFPQAIVARTMLGMHGIPYAIHFGLMPERRAAAGTPTQTPRVASPAAPAGMRAHAWVVAGRVPVTGGHSFDHYTVVGVFTGP
jgi:hypothetical protein